MATKLKFYNPMVKPILFCGRKSWTIKDKQRSRIEEAEMTLRRVKGSFWLDKIISKDIPKIYKW